MWAPNTVRHPYEKDPKRDPQFRELPKKNPYGPLKQTLIDTLIDPFKEPLKGAQIYRATLMD